MAVWAPSNCFSGAPRTTDTPEAERCLSLDSETFRLTKNTFGSLRLGLTSIRPRSSDEGTFGGAGAAFEATAVAMEGLYQADVRRPGAANNIGASRSSATPLSVPSLGHDVLHRGPGGSGMQSPGLTFW